MTKRSKNTNKLPEEKDLPGTIFPNNGRYWWRVKLPGETKRRPIALKPAGAKFATKDRSVAVQIAKQILDDIEKRKLKSPRDYDGRICSLITHYLVYANAYYGETGKEHAKYDVAQLLELYGDTFAQDFNSIDFKLVIEAMIDANLARKTINDRISRIKRAFKWAAGEMMIPKSVYDNLLVVENLHRGRSINRVNDPQKKIAPKETKKKKPVSLEVIKQTLPLLSPTLRAMVRLHRIQGTRSTELCIIRACDIDMTDEVWVYTPKNPTGWDFKMQWQGKVDEKEICIGPRAQAILKPFILNRPADEFLFKPEESENWYRQQKSKKRTTPLKYGNKPGTNNKGIQKFRPCFTHGSYRKAIQAACDKAFPPPTPLAKRTDETNKQWGMRLTVEQKQDLNVWKKKHRWHPHQLRHAATTRIVEQFSQEDAQAFIGHSDKTMTQLYSHTAKLTKAKKVAKKVG